jgi:type II secretory pathway pseudopilin PulG
MRNGRAARARAGGYTYVAVLLWVALVGVGLATTGEVWKTTAQREREAELLFIGEQFRRALTSYHEASPGAQRFPPTLAALLRDERHPTVRRHLRKVYVDPMTGKPEWGLVRQPDGAIVGVHSLSAERPLRTGNFRGYREAFAGKDKYSDWVFRPDVAAFVAAPPATPGAPQPATTVRPPVTP